MKRYALFLLVVSVSFSLTLTVKSAETNNLETNETETSSWIVVDPWDESKLAKEPRPGYYKFFNACVNDELTKNCGDQTYDFVFYKKTIDTSCCCLLAQLRDRCRKAVSWTMANLDQSNRNKTGRIRRKTVYKRSAKAFQMCTWRCRKHRLDC